MQVRVVADQPWDVKADVLAIPIVGEPEFEGPLGELNRRSGGATLRRVTDIAAILSARGALASHEIRPAS